MLTMNCATTLLSLTHCFILGNSCVVLQAILCTRLTVALSQSVKKVICIYF